MQVMRKYLTEAQQGKLLAHLKKLESPFAKRDRAWISLLMRTGMRIGEFSRMTVGDASFALETGWIHIAKARRKGKRKDHDVPVTDAIEQDLQALLKQQKRLGGTGAGDEPLVPARVRDHAGELAALSVRSYQARMDHWSRECGFDYSPHALRHTCAMNIMRRTTAEDPRSVVQGVLGHADIRSSGIYTALNQEELRRGLEESHGPRRIAKRNVGKAYERRVGA